MELPVVRSTRGQEGQKGAVRGASDWEQSMYQLPTTFCQKKTTNNKHGPPEDLGAVLYQLSNCLGHKKKII